MPANQPSSEDAPSAEELKERVSTLGEQTNLGAANKEPDPATAENPPTDAEYGDEKRHST